MIMIMNKLRLIFNDEKIMKNKKKGGVFYTPFFYCLCVCVIILNERIQNPMDNGVFKNYNCRYN